MVSTKPSVTTALNVKYSVLRSHRAAKLLQVLLHGVATTFYFAILLEWLALTKLLELIERLGVGLIHVI